MFAPENLQRCLCCPRGNYFLGKHVGRVTWSPWRVADLGTVQARRSPSHLGVFLIQCVLCTEDWRHLGRVTQEVSASRRAAERMLWERRVSTQRQCKG